MHAFFLASGAWVSLRLLQSCNTTVLLWQGLVCFVLGVVMVAGSKKALETATTQGLLLLVGSPRRAGR